MANPFLVYGPFEAPYEKFMPPEGRKIEKDWWQTLDDALPGLRGAVGVYLCSRRHGENYEPVYVGMTERAFEIEIFNDSNLLKYHSYFNERRGALTVHLLAKPRALQRGYSTNISKEKLLWLERLLILLCQHQNDALINRVGSPFLEDISIENVLGIFRQGGKAKAVETFIDAIGLRI